MNRRMWVAALVPGVVVVCLLFLADFYGIRAGGFGWIERIAIWLTIGLPFVLSWYWFKDGGWSERRRGSQSGE